MKPQFAAMAELNREERILLFLHHLVVLLAGLLFLPILWAQEIQPSGHEMVGAFHAAFGEHHARAVHGAGVVVRGSVTPSAETAAYTTAWHPQQSAGTVSVVARFSAFAGTPDRPTPNSSKEK